MRHFAGTLLICFTLNAVMLHPQEPMRGPDNEARITVPGVEVLAVPGMPFSGVDHIEWTQTSADSFRVCAEDILQICSDGFPRRWSALPHPGNARYR